MDKGNKRALTRRGNRAMAESGAAMKVAMDLHAAVGFTHAFATDGSKEGGRNGKTAYGAWSGAHMLRWGAQDEPGSRDLVMTDEQETAAVGGG